MITGQRSFRTCKRSWQASQTYQNLQWEAKRPMCRCGWLFMASETQKIWRYPRIQNLKILKVFSISPRNLVSENSDIRNVNYMDTTSPSWTRSTLLSDRTLKRTKAKVHVYSDSVLCLGKIHDPVEAVEQWKGHVTTVRMENSFSELSGIR